MKLLREVRQELIGKTPGLKLLHASIWGGCAYLAENDPTLSSPTQQRISSMMGAFALGLTYQAVRQIQSEKKIEREWQMGLKKYEQFYPTEK